MTGWALHPARHGSGTCDPVPYDPLVDAVTRGEEPQIGVQRRNRPGPAAKLGTECIVELLHTEGLIEGELDGLFRRHGLTGPGFNVLMILEGAGEPLPPGEIGERRLVTRGTVTGLIDTLEARGLVRRTPHPEDRRMLLIELTEDARALVRTVSRELFPLQEEMTSVLSVLEKTMLVRMLRRLQAHVGTPAS